MKYKKRAGALRKLVDNPVERPDHRPYFVTDDMLIYMDALRDEGANMLGIAPHIAEHYHITDIRYARTIVIYWFKTYCKRHHITSTTYDTYFDGGT